MPDMTPEQVARAAEYSNAYRIGQRNGRNGGSTNWARWSDQAKAGYRAGYAWGLEHPLAGQEPATALNFPGMPPIKGVGPVLTEIPPVRPDWLYGPGGALETDPEGAE